MTAIWLGLLVHGAEGEIVTLVLQVSVTFMLEAPLEPVAVTIDVRATVLPGVPENEAAPVPVTVTAVRKPDETHELTAAGGDNVVAVGNAAFV